MRIFALLLVLFVVACASSGGDKEEDSGRKAAETNTSLGQAYMAREQYEVALEKLKRAVASDKTYAPAHTLLGVLYETIGEMDQAEKEFGLAVKYAPDNGDVNNNYGAFLCRNGRGETADPYFAKAVKDPFYTTPEVAYVNAGNCMLGLGNLDKAESYLRQSLEYDDQNADALLSMADVSYRRGSFLRARAFLQRYEAVGTPTEESLSLGYRIETELKDSKSADRYRQELLERYPASEAADQEVGRDQG